jgi:membrane protein YdbS with pleckstrin-like domain
MSHRFWHAQWDRPNDTPRGELDVLETSLWRTTVGIATAMILLGGLGIVIWLYANEPLVWVFASLALLVTSSVVGLIWVSRRSNTTRDRAE